MANTRMDRSTAMLQLYQERRLTLQEIADLFGVSRQRVHQILRNAGDYQPRRTGPKNR